MCVSILIRNSHPEIPLILANNRDEMINRNFIPPTLLDDTKIIIGPKDLERGGTWLGINKKKIFANLLNLWTDKEHFFGSKQYKSRGTLVLEILNCSSTNEIINYLKNLYLKEFLPFFLIFGNIEETYLAIMQDNTLNINKINENIFIVGNINPYNKKWEKYQYGYNFLEQIFNKKKMKKEIFNILSQLLKTHKGSQEIPSTDYAVNLGEFCTTSSSIIFFKENGLIDYFFANGSPLNTIYQNYFFITKFLIN